jgi:hypothetical protein
MLGLGNSLVNSSVSSWAPSDESSLVAWYQYQTGITLNDSDVSKWADYTNTYEMRQATAINQPAYSNGTLTFDSADTQFLQTAGQITLAGDFTIGFRVHPTAFTGTVLGDNTTTSEFMRFNGASFFRVSIFENTAQNFTLLTPADDDYYVLTRSGTTIRLYQNGATADSHVFSPLKTVDIDAIGIRRTDTSPFNGTMKEIQIYSSTSAALTANVNSRLASL